jgi:DNA polymerase I-like protein with 3'-5' exonuclease and polymerase domains
VILTEDRLREFVDYSLKQDAVFFDIETTGPNRGVPHLNTACWLGLATHGHAVSIPHGHPIGTKVIDTRREPRLCNDGKTRNYKVPVYEAPPPQLTTDLVYDITRPIFESERISKVAHDASFDLASTAKYLGGVASRPYECNIVLDWILNENRHAYGLKVRTKQAYGVAYDKDNTGRRVEKFPFADVAHYVYMDVKYGWMLYQRHRPGIEREGLEDIYGLELDILEVMVSMRLRGAAVDVPRIEALREEMGARLEVSTGKVYAAAGKRFNINSGQQKQQLLWGPKSAGGQGLKPWKLTDSARERKKKGAQTSFGPKDYSTDAESLESFPRNPLATELLGYQEINKLLSTYILGWLGDPDNDKPCLIFDGRIHANFVQYGARTGRFSCREPNLQNIPRSGTELGKLIRDAWIAPPGYKLIVADYGQIELVVLAHFIGRGKLFDGFLAGIDPHTTTAAGVLGIDPATVTPDQRQKLGKSLNFAVVFGAMEKKLASMIGCSEREAGGFMGDHEEEFPEIYAYKDAIIQHALKQEPVPYVKTLLGRKRRLPELYSRDWGMRSYAERQAVNSKIQGSAADLIKLAMVRTHAGLMEIPDAAIDLTVHDELVLSAPEEHAERVAEILQDGMTGEGIQKLVRVPLVADVKIGDRWGEMK